MDDNKLDKLCRQPTKLRDQNDIKSAIYKVYKNHVQSDNKVQWMDFKLDNQTLKFAVRSWIQPRH